MAQDEQQDRHLEPTPRKRQKAREDGQTARSRELNTQLLLMVSSGILLLSGNHLFKIVLTQTKRLYQTPRAQLLDLSNNLSIIINYGQSIFFAVLPFFGLLIFISLISPGLLGGWLFSPKALLFKGERLDPIKGIKRMFSIKSLVELLKAIAKFLIILLASVLFLWWQHDAIMHLIALPLAPAVTQGLNILGIGFLCLSLSLTLITLVDVPFQIWQHTQQLKMSPKEVKDESKETDVSPELKTRIRSLQQNLAKKRMMSEIPKANVVITNPTHYAIALRYDEGTDTAPKVIAKGAGYLAQKIRELATEHHITLYSAPPLARALYFNTEIGEEIPTGLYISVAKILTFVYQLKLYQAGYRTKPNEIDELPIPDDLQYQLDD